MAARRQSQVFPQTCSPRKCRFPLNTLLGDGRRPMLAFELMKTRLANDLIVYTNRGASV
jgi:hypothetical protein